MKRKVMVEESKWARGCPGQLFDGRRYCVLGFVGKAYGIADEEMLDKPNPYNVKSSLWPKTIFGSMQSSIAYNMTRINDAAETSDAEKKKLLKTWAKRADIELEFVP